MDGRQPRAPWRDRRIVLGVCGGIAAYKLVQVARDLTLLGAHVDVVLTRSAQRFVTPLTFEGVTGRPAHTDLWSVEGAALHLALAERADVVVVAPATADALARAATGRADDLLGTVLLATRAPVLLAPAMNTQMWEHPQVQANVRHCVERLGYDTVGPAVGPLAAGEQAGAGRLADGRDIVAHIGRVLGANSAWQGRNVVVTAGPTREALDPVRYLGNRSSGRMGYAIAEQAWLRGAEVTLVSGPTTLEPPVGVTVLRVESARDMLEAVRGPLEDADVAVYAAAVADYRPQEAHEHKIKRSGASESLELPLRENPDVARETRSLGRPGIVRVGFALETDDLEEHARAKMEAKGFDLIVANDAGEPGAGFEVETNRVTLITPDAEPDRLPLAPKVEVAARICDKIERRFAGRAAPAPGAPRVSAEQGPA
jgi:phosphopantothenoylcysteine decarboxylase/phosphopantothenate--cysteine ligase